MIRIYNEENFKELERDWNVIYASNPNHTPFQTFAYNLVSWNSNIVDGLLHIITIWQEENKRLLAIFPCYIDKNKCLRFINDTHTDFCGTVVRLENQYSYHLYSEFAEYVITCDEIKSVSFDNLNENNYLLSVLRYFFKGAIVRITNAWSSIEISPATNEKLFIDDLSWLASRERYKLKREYKAVKEGGFELFTVATRPYPAPIVNALIAHMIQTGIRVSDYFSDSFKHFIEQCYNQGIMSIAVTTIDNIPTAAHFYFVKDQCTIAWIILYKEGRYLTYNTLQTIDEISKTGGGIFNFARGLYGYKVEKFRPVMHNLYRISYSKSKLGQFVNWLECCKYYLKTILKPIIRRQK